MPTGCRAQQRGLRGGKACCCRCDRRRRQRLNRRLRHGREVVALDQRSARRGAQRSAVNKQWVLWSAMVHCAASRTSSAGGWLHRRPGEMCARGRVLRGESSTTSSPQASAQLERSKSDRSLQSTRASESAAWMDRSVVKTSTNEPGLDSCGSSRVVQTLTLLALPGTELAEQLN